jgi:hypothetical protein
VESRGSGSGEPEWGLARENRGKDEHSVWDCRWMTGWMAGLSPNEDMTSRCVDAAADISLGLAWHQGACGLFI